MENLVTVFDSIKSCFGERLFSAFRGGIAHNSLLNISTCPTDCRMTGAAEKRSQKGVMKGTGIRFDLRTESPKNNMPVYNITAAKEKWIIITNLN